MTDETLADQLERLQLQHWNIPHVSNREKEILMLAVTFAAHAVAAGADLSGEPAVNWRDTYAEWCSNVRDGQAAAPRVAFSRLYSTAMAR